MATGSAVLNGLPSGNWTLNPGAITGSGASTTLTGLAANTYKFTVTNDAGCISPASSDVVIIASSGAPTEPNAELSVYNGFNISCFGKSDGFIRLNPAGFGPYRFSWSGPGGFTSSDKDISGVIAGQYSLSITDVNNCSTNPTFTLTEPDPLVLTFHVTEPFCPGKSDGEIILDVTGGVPGIDYNYKWSNSSTDKNLLNIPEGMYKVTVGDLNGCSMEGSVQVSSKNETCLIIPNAISPNGDNINDVWNIGHIDQYPLAEVTIINNWGETVWKSAKGYPIPWDGTSNGVILPIDSYFYIINLHDGSKLIAGSITIIK
jgi:gliding motility-associated-like protein